MARVKTAMITRKKHKKVLKRAKGYYGAKHYRFRMAKQQVMKSGNYAFVGRKDKKSNFRKLWIARINAAARMKFNIQPINQWIKEGKCCNQQKNVS